MTARIDIPSEFIELTSARLRREPEPQYLHARIMQMATGATLGMSLGDLAGPGRPSIGNSGAAYSGIDADRFMLSELPMAGMIDVVEEFGTLPGHTVKINRPAFTGNAHTEAAREVKVGQTIATSGQAIGGNQVKLTMKRYGGPHNGTNVAPYDIERFDMNRSLHRAADIVGKHLKRDYDKTTDVFLRSLFDYADPNKILYGGSAAAVDDFAVAGDGPMTMRLLLDMEELLKSGDIPMFADGSYGAILTPKQCRQLQSDSQYSRLSEDFPLYNALFAGSYVRKVGKFHVFSSNTLNTTANTNSIPVHRAQVFGPEAVGVGLGELPRVARAVEDNFGETAHVIWLLYAAFGVLDNRFIGSIRTS